MEAVAKIPCCLCNGKGHIQITFKQEDIFDGNLAPIELKAMCIDCIKRIGKVYNDLETNGWSLFKITALEGEQ